MTRRPADQERWGRTMRRWPEAEAKALGSTMRVKPFEVWRSRDFLAQFYDEGGQIRVSVNRTHMPNGIDWAAGISWDDLMRVKAEVGHAETWAVEVYPPETEVVNLANMRHLWLLSEAPAYGWKGQAEDAA